MEAPRQICFMVMPYGRKPTGQGADGPSEIDFDALWDRVLRPVIESLGYQPVRADQDVGALIIHEMLERLYFSDLVLAEMTVPNGNVYYEIGVRHACNPRGCVLLAADWAKPLFDVAQLRTVHYALREPQVTEDAAVSLRASLSTKIAPLISGSSPVYDVLPGYPGPVDASRASAMRESLKAASKYQEKFSAVRVAPREQQPAMAAALIAEARATQPMSQAVGLGLMRLLRNLGYWQQSVDLFHELPAAIAEQSSVVEMVNFAKSNLGGHLEAIAGLEALIQSSGASSEREGLIGGRYKRLFNSASGPDKSRYLNQAIKHYELGMMLDLNDYFPSCNLPRLYRARNLAGDLEKAKSVGQVVYQACMRARQLNSSDQWLRPTLLAAAFDAGDPVAAETVYGEMMQEGCEAWQLRTTLSDLRLTLSQLQDAAAVKSLTDILSRFELLC